MKKILRFSILTALFVGIMAVATSCEDDETYNPEISLLRSTNKDISTNAQGFPGDLIVAEGVELNNMKAIGFVTTKDTVNVVFNPVLNSPMAVMFNIPFDEDLGSELGMQQILFVNKNGTEVTKAFEVLQPEPEISSFSPARPKAGESTTIQGKWFQNLESVSFAGQAVEYTQFSSTEIYIEIPEGAEPDDVVVTTSVGMVSEYLDVDLGYNVYLYNDLDGGGLFANNEWWNNGDLTDPVVISTEGGIDGNYAEITWSGSTSNGWGNAETSSGANPAIQETNQEDVLFVFEVFCVSGAGSSMQIQIDDGGTTWAHDYTFSEDEVGKWITVEMSTYDFGRSYDPSNQTHDMDLQGISKVKVAINSWSGIVPTTVRVDNLRFHGYY
ncbi:glycan-binding surface protein [Saccharicrinis fermentans]|uniref:IPT/TIG domain-containing protein n=1 Tax=Saccharicrinis fermentans DSM 9555 = JCM 21142 TaxID=869213 RepID=W7Y4Z2_9BACT|nr:glycan-binding surface protein [Saccharicrinis fermentans]GAF03172.1 hypothetical protein JCM21142_41837 [Saccharicrinis fermentans DSM 9555 = JCM 21142]